MKRLLAAAVAGMLAGCTRNAPAVPKVPAAAAPAREPEAVLTVSPLALDVLETIVPLGNLNPPWHTLPSDHIYLYPNGEATGKRLDVFAPGAGKVRSVSGPTPDDVRLVVDATSQVRWYLDHVRPAEGIRPGSRVEAGQKIGVTSGQSHALDLGIIDDRVTRRKFARPERYSGDTIHCAAPLQYFEPGLREKLYAKVDCDGRDRDGQVDQDVPGTLAGNWFLEDLPVDEGASSPANGPRQLAFVCDKRKPARLGVSVGGSVSEPGVWWLESGVDQVTPKSGAVALGLTRDRHDDPDPLDSPSTIPFLLVEMLSPDRIRVELFFGQGPSGLGFSARSRIYVR